MTQIEEKATFEAISNMSPDEMQIAIQAFPIEVVFNELERRERERIDLLDRLDELNKFVGGITR